MTTEFDKLLSMVTKLNNRSGEECMVCHFPDDKENLLKLDCNHYYHKNCITITNSKFTCPYCKKITIFKTSIQSNPTSVCNVILKSGIIVISKTNYVGYETSVDIKYTGDGFGWASSIDSGPRTGRALAIVNSEYWTFDKSVVAELLNNRNFNNNLLLYLLKYIRINENILTNIHSTQADQKVLSQLLRIGIYENKNNIVLIHNKINQGIIASFSGVSRETVSREVKKLKNQSINEMDNKKNIILNVNKANKLLNFNINKI